MTFTEIATALEQGIDSPDLVQSYRNKLAAWMYRLHNEYGKLKAEMAVWLTQNRGEYKSYNETEKAWDATKQGTKRLEIKYTLKGMHELQDALKSQAYLMNREWKETGGEG